jgi:hypothetical protein
VLVLSGSMLFDQICSHRRIRLKYSVKVLNSLEDISATKEAFLPLLFGKALKYSANGQTSLLVLLTTGVEVEPVALVI